jgi:hypothetical protein
MRRLLERVGFRVLKERHFMLGVNCITVGVKE